MADHYKAKDILRDPDLEKLLRQRVESRFRKLCRAVAERWPNMVVEAKKRWTDLKVDENFGDLQIQRLAELCYEGIARTEFLSFQRRECPRYKKKYKTDYLNDIQKAREGSNRHLYRIVAWDKYWLFTDWAQAKVMDAQENNDQIFLFDTGTSLQKKPGYKVVPKKDNKLIESLKVFFDFYDYTGKPDAIRGVSGHLIDTGKVSRSKNASDRYSLDDPDYFVKWLNRHKIIA